MRFAKLRPKPLEPTDGTVRTDFDMANDHGVHFEHFLCGKECLMKRLNVEMDNIGEVRKEQVAA